MESLNEETSNKESNCRTFMEVVIKQEIKQENKELNDMRYQLYYDENYYDYDIIFKEERKDNCSQHWEDTTFENRLENMKQELNLDYMESAAKNTIKLEHSLIVSNHQAGEIEDSNKLLVENDLACDQTTESRGNVCYGAHEIAKTYSKLGPYSCLKCGFTFIDKSKKITVLKQVPTKLDKSTIKEIQVCGTCPMRFSSIEFLENHNKLYTLKCAACRLCFFSQTKYRNHFKKIHKMVVSTIFKCEICNKCFNKRSKLHKHNRACHIPRVLYKCESCEYICKSEKRLERHQFGHTKSQTKSHPCTLCNESFILKAGLLCHLKTHNCDFSEKCYECDKTFSSVCDDENHTTTHHGEHTTYVKCHVCCLTFRHQYFKQHAKTHKMNKYQCEICGVCLSLLSSLKVHKHAYHFKSKNFCCDQCGKTYLTNYRLTKHMSTHTGVKNYLCDVCGINFSILSNFQRHMLIHDDLRPFKCPICPYTCRQKVCLIAHMLCHSVLRPFKCSLCPYSCKQRSYLSNHMKCHTYNGKPFICGECEFSSHHKEGVLLHHLKIHNGVKSYTDQTLENAYYYTTEIKGKMFYVCKQCDYKCSNVTVIKEHNFIHSKLGIYRCNECDYTTMEKVRLQKHLRGHYRRGKYQCDSCSFSGHQISRLKLHMKVHSDERPFCCDICGFPCKSNESLAKHKKSHGDVRTYICSVCQSRWIKKRELLRHISLMHPD